MPYAQRARVLGYNANIISTVVDTVAVTMATAGYNANIISTVVDARDRQLWFDDEIE